MQKRGKQVLTLVFLSTILLLGVVSAFSFSDFFNNLFGNSVTGNVVASIDNGLIAYYKFDESTVQTTTAADSSGNNMNGVIGSGVTSISGKFSNAFRFSGSASVSIQGLDFSSKEYTISGWVRTTQPGEAERWRNWINKNDYETTPFELGIDDGRSTNVSYFETWIYGQGAPVNIFANDGSNMRDGQWHHIVATYKKGEQRLYHNGALVAASFFNQDFPITSSAVNIGGQQLGYYHRPWIGDIDEVRIYNRALNTSEVRQLYSPTNSTTGSGGGGGGGTTIQSSVNCTDSDNGLEYSIKGTTSGWSTALNSAMSATDSCANSNLLAEYTCGTNSAVIYNEYTCPNGCSNGACIQNTTTTPICTDSDNGINYYVKGIATGYYPYTTNIVNLTDSCDSTYAGFINENFCLNNNTVSTTPYQCPNGCSNGACIQNTTTTPICTDSDGGKNYYVIGTTKKGDLISTDYCTSLGGLYDSSKPKTYVGEFTCGSSEEIVSEPLYNCTNGCSNGACVCNLTNLNIKNLILTSSDLSADNPSTIGNYEDQIDPGINNGFAKALQSGGQTIWLTPSQTVSLSFAKYANALDAETMFDIIDTQNSRQQVSHDNSIGDETFCETSPDFFSRNSKYYYICGFRFKEIYVNVQTTLNVNSSARAVETLKKVYEKIKDNCNVQSNPPINNPVCYDLISEVKHPTSTQERRISWNETYDGYEYVNGKDEHFTSYQASWNWNSPVYRENEMNYYYASYYVQVFDNQNIDLSNQLRWNKQNPACKTTSYWIGGQENSYYICNWDALNNRQSIDSYQSVNRQISWVNGNVVVRMYLYSGKQLSDTEVIKLSQQKLNDLMNNLQNNEYKYIDWSNFNINYPMSNELVNALEKCKSEIEINESIYSPSWNCKTEPVICPEYGYQTRICRSWNEEMQKDDVQEEKIYCSPGLCSGCYTPRWSFSSNSDNICVPYGTRLSIESGETGEFYQSDVQYVDDVMNITILPSNTATISLVSLPSEIKSVTVNGQDYNQVGDSMTAYQGNEYDISINFVDTRKPEVIKLRVTKISYSENPEKSYIQMKIIDNYNAYCNYNGDIYRQKTTDYNNNWAKCQNNYECESNLCSYGECVELKAIAGEVSGIKGLFIRMLCRLSNLFDSTDYAKCIYDYLGENITSPPVSVCGNNILENGEECDDGNTIDGDGCSSLCKMESVIITGDSVNLATSARRLYFKDPINAAKMVLYSSDMPNTLNDGKVIDLNGATYVYTQSLRISPVDIIYGTSGGDLTDPSLILQVGTYQNAPLYNYTVSFTKNINISNPNVQGEKIKILGKDYLIGPGSSSTLLYLIRAEQTLDIKSGDTKTVNVAGNDFLVELVSVSSAETLKLTVDGVSKTMTKGNSYSFSGDLTIYVKDITFQSYSGGIQSAELVLGTNTLKIEDGMTVKKGPDQITISGTNTKIFSYEGMVSGFTIAVAMQKSQTDHIAVGDSYTDPVFGGLSVKFADAVPELNDASRTKIVVDTDNKEFANVRFTSAQTGTERQLTYAYDNDTSSTEVQPLLAFKTVTSSNKGIIHVLEGENAKVGDLIVINQGDNGAILQVDGIDVTAGDATGTVTFSNVLTGASIDPITLTSSGTGPFIKTGVNLLGGSGYIITASSNTVSINWSSPGTTTLYPRIKLANGGWIAFLTEKTISNGTNIILPNGKTTLDTIGSPLASFGEFTRDGMIWNRRMETDGASTITSLIPSSRLTSCYFGANRGPAILYLEPKKWDDSDYGGYICIPIIPTNEIAIGDPVFSGINSGFITSGSDTYKKSAVDKFGVFVTKEDRTNENGVATILAPSSQMYLDVLFNS